MRVQWRKQLIANDVLQRGSLKLADYLQFVAQLVPNVSLCVAPGRRQHRDEPYSQIQSDLSMLVIIRHGKIWLLCSFAAQARCCVVRIQARSSKEWTYPTSHVSSRLQPAPTDRLSLRLMCNAGLRCSGNCKCRVELGNGDAVNTKAGASRA